MRHPVMMTKMPFAEKKIATVSDTADQDQPQRQIHRYTDGKIKRTSEEPMEKRRQNL